MRNLAKKLKALGVVVRGSFVLHSGAVSDYYIDVKQAYGDPATLQALAVALAKKIPKEATCVAATGHGGIPLATAVSLHAKLPLVLVRDSVKNHGRETILDGYAPGKSDAVALVDDVLTTGASAQEMAGLVSEHGAKIAGLCVVVSRGTHTLSFPYTSLFAEKELSS